LIIKIDYFFFLDLMVIMEVIPCSLVEAFTKKKKIMLPLIYMIDAI